MIFNFLILIDWSISIRISNCFTKGLRQVFFVLIFVEPLLNFWSLHSLFFAFEFAFACFWSFEFAHVMPFVFLFVSVYPRGQSELSVKRYGHFSASKVDILGATTQIKNMMLYFQFDIHFLKNITFYSLFVMFLSYFYFKFIT